jgi:hypothetical protein
MDISVHHHYDGEAHTYFGGGHYHDKKYKKLAFASCRCIDCNFFGVMHFGKCYEQQIHGIQHKLDAHKNDDRIPARQYTHYSYAE